jgi:hypothetical protein
MIFVLLAPGPSLSQALADSVRGFRVGVLTSAYPLAPWAEFLAATDAGFWRKYPEAKDFAGAKYSAAKVGDEVAQVTTPHVGLSSSSGVLGLEVAKQRGATRILLLGFDHRGTHFFGPYKNGLRNTPERRRLEHEQQFAQWGRVNKDIEVWNCTEGSALKCFPMARLENELDCLDELAERRSRKNSGIPKRAREAGLHA